MPVNISIDTSGENESFAYIFNEFPIKLSEVIIGQPQYYAGSVIQIEELLKFQMVIDDMSLVDIDFRWRDPKLYLASYQISPGITGILSGYTDEGHINHETTILKYYSWYVVSGDENVPIGLHTQGDIQACNFYLQPELYLFPGELTPVPGYKTHGIIPDFLYTETLKTVNLQDVNFNQKARSIGVHLFAGVRCDNVQYIVTDINRVRVNLNPYNSPTCNFPKPSCEQQFAAYRNLNPQLYTTPQEVLQATGHQANSLDQWICPTDASVVFQSYYYDPNAGGGGGGSPT